MPFPRSKIGVDRLILFNRQTSIGPILYGLIYSFMQSGIIVDFLRAITCTDGSNFRHLANYVRKIVNFITPGRRNSLNIDVVCSGQVIFN